MRRRLPHPRYTIRLRLTLIYGCVFLACGAVLVAVTYLLARQTSKGPVYSIKASGANVVLKGPHGPVALGDLRALPPAGAIYSRVPGGTAHESASAGTTAPVTPADGQRKLLAFAQCMRSHGVTNFPQPVEGQIQFRVNGSGGLNPGSAPFEAAAKECRTLLPNAGEPAAFAGVSLPALRQARAQAVQLAALGRQQHQDELHQLLIDLAIALAIVAIVSMGLGWLVAGRALRPLQTITKAARAISSTNLHKRLSLSGPNDELRELGDTFDDLLERLERSFAAQRQFVANASHELRTPLTLERTVLEVALADPSASAPELRATCERVLAIGEQQERMIEALLTLARSERGLDQRRVFDLRVAAREVLASRRPEIGRRGLRLDEELGVALTSGDPRLAERLIANLLDNAIRHNRSDGRIRIATAADSGEAVLSVSNSGPVVPPEQVDQLFEPFRRMGPERSAGADGHGLGLSIVAAIAGVHGAKVKARAPRDGGLDVIVRFPGATGVASLATERPPQRDRHALDLALAHPGEERERE
jgi:signal transduction histidine kinase